MSQTTVDQIWYQGKELRSPGRKFLGFIVVDENKDKTHSQRYRVRIPAIHGYADLNGKNAESDKITPNSALPLARSHASLGDLSQNVTGSGNGKYDAGNWVIVEFRDHENLKDPVIVAKDSASNAIYGGKEKFNAMSQYIPSQLVKPNPESKVLQATGAFNGCTEVVTDAQMIPANGAGAQGADKCGQSGAIKNSFAANIADFLKIIQDTDGKIGSSFVDKYTGELFKLTNYITQYTSAITSLFRSAIGWIKAQITKYVRKAIDMLVKAIMRPIKGVTKIVNETIEKVLEMVGCTFGNLEALISNLIEGLLNSLIDQALNAVFGCLDALVDGILNEIMSEVMSLVNSIVSAFSSIAGMLSSFGDLFGSAINEILEFLGISCGGSNKCGTGDTFIAKVNTPGEYGVSGNVLSFLSSGVGAINNVSRDIDKSSGEASAAAEEAAKGIDLGTSTYDGSNTGNSGLNKAFNTAAQILGPQVAGVFDFCNQIAEDNGTNGTNDNGTGTGSGTNVVIIGDEKYTYYMITPLGSSVKTGSVQQFEITRDNDTTEGIINFVVWLEPTDTARVVGITTGLTSGGDLIRNVKLSASDYGSDPKSPDRELPIANNVVISEKVSFSIGERRKIVVVPTLPSSSPDSITSEVTYTAGLFRSVDDITNEKYSDTNLPNTSSTLNTVTGVITFDLPTSPIDIDTQTVDPPTVNISNLTYASQDRSVLAGNSIIFTITRSPVTAEASQIKVVTIPNTAQDGIHYTGGQAFIDFAPNESSKSFSVSTLNPGNISNSVVDFKVRLTDVIVPNGMTSNLGGASVNNTTSVGSGMTYTGSITYSAINSALSSSVVPLCPADIIITSPPPTCIVHPDTQDLYIGLIARTTVAGYTLSYQWQRTYNPTSGWTNITNGVRSETVNQRVTTFQQLTTAVISGVTLAVSGWTTNIVPTPASITYSGANSTTLGFRPSYLLNDEEYYRCLITATPSVITGGLSTISAVTNPTYLGVTSSGVFLTTVNCSPTVPSGVIITYSGTTPTPGGVTAASGVVCLTPVQPIPEVSSVPPVTLPVASGITPAPEMPSNPDGERIDPVQDPTNRGPIIAPAVVGPNGDVISVIIPENLPTFRSIPLIPIIGTGVGATARAELDDNGKLSNIIINSKGFGYTPNVASGKFGCGILDQINVSIVGGYFETSPTVYVDGDSEIAVAAINNNGQVVEIRIVNPKNKVYDSIPRIDIVGDGYGAAAIASIKYVDCDKVAEEYLKVVDKYSTSTIGTVKVEDCP